MKLTNYIRDAFINSAIADVPQTDYDERIRGLIVKDFVDQLPTAVREIWEKESTCEYVYTTYQSFFNVSAAIPVRRNAERKLTIEAQKKLAELAVKSKAQDREIRELKSKLRSVAYSCTTRKKLVELLPEFEKYLPADEQQAAKVMLPAVANVVADFTKAGWPKNKTK